MPRLLSRDHFREGVFARDSHKCVICVRDSVKYVRENYKQTSLEGFSDAAIKRNLLEMATALGGGKIGEGAIRYMGMQTPVPQDAVDAHHIIERRLWPDGGYYLDNGASLCEIHHIQAEQTVLGCPELREAAGIVDVLLPPHLYSDQAYDKWGNPILPNGHRLKGELFHDESVQKILMSAPLYANTFMDHVKYPRTYHLPWSPNLTKDDRMMPDVRDLEGKQVVATLKMDGENTTMYSDFIHARSLTLEPHPSRDRVKALHGSMAHDIPKGWRICGENLYAEHSISYSELPGYFLMFSVWNNVNICLSWNDTKEWAALLNLPMVQTLYEGVFSRTAIEEAFKPYADKNEGYVVRLAERFPYSAFRHAVGKYVRKNHVHTHGHWMRQRLVPNKLQGEK